MLGEEGCSLSPDDRHTKTPRWWAVAPPTPAEAPEAKRRTAARSRGSIILLMVAVSAVLVFAISLLSRIGRQVGETGPTVAAPAPTVPTGNQASTLPSPVPREEETGRTTADGGTPSRGAPGASSVRSRPTSEVFRRPGF